MTLDLDKVDSHNIFGTPGSGNQKKCWLILDGVKVLAKVDSRFNQSIKEVSVSKVLDVLGINHSPYSYSSFKLNGKIKPGCLTPSYLKDSEQSLPIYLFMDAYTPCNGETGRDYFNRILHEFSDSTGLKFEDVSEYILTLMALDYIFMNGDRHLANIEVVTDKNYSWFRLSPYYDFGQAFLDLIDLDISPRDFQVKERHFTTQPFYENPDKNIIDVEFASGVARLFLDRKSEILDLRIPDLFKFIIFHCCERLLNLSSGKSVWKPLGELSFN